MFNILVAPTEDTEIQIIPWLPQRPLFLFVDSPLWQINASTSAAELILFHCLVERALYKRRSVSEYRLLLSAQNCHCIHVVLGRCNIHTSHNFAHIIYFSWTFILIDLDFHREVSCSNNISDMENKCPECLKKTTIS